MVQIQHPLPTLTGTFRDGVYKTEYMSIQTKIVHYFGGWILERLASPIIALGTTISPSTAPDDPPGRIQI